MFPLFKSAVLVAAIVIGGSAAIASPCRHPGSTFGYGNALREAAQAGQITPHGVWDGK